MTYYEVQGAKGSLFRQVKAGTGAVWYQKLEAVQENENFPFTKLT